MSLRTAHLEYRTIETAPTPLGEIMLRRYDTDDGRFGYEIRLNGNFLMATHGNSSESAMPELAHEWLGEERENLTVLVGGLGAGYTLRAALQRPHVTKAVVVEISEKVVEWNRTYFAETNGDVLADPRVEVVIGDLADHIRTTRNRYDMALLDVDNGPGWVAAGGNERLYTDDGLLQCRAILKEGGILAVWSPSENALFAERFASIFAERRIVDTTEIGKRVGEPGDVIYLGRNS